MRFVILARNRVAHPQEVCRIAEVVLGINEWLADGIFVGHGGERRQLRDHADRCDVALHGVGNIRGVVIKGRQRAHRADHHGHRMGVAAESLVEPAHLLVDHRVAGHEIVEVVLLSGGRKFAVKQEVTGFEEIAVLCKLLDRIPAIEQNALVTVDIGDFGLAARGRGITRIVGEDVSLIVQLGDVDYVWPDGTFIHRKCVALVTQGQSAGFGIGTGTRVHAGILDEKGAT
jgi:hypothetical protein